MSVSGVSSGGGGGGSVSSSSGGGSSSGSSRSSSGGGSSSYGGSFGPLTGSIGAGGQSNLAGYNERRRLNAQA